MHNNYDVTTVDLSTFGNKTSTCGARPKQDFVADDFDSVIGPESGPMPKGASNMPDLLQWYILKGEDSKNEEVKEMAKDYKQKYNNKR